MQPSDHPAQSTSDGHSPAPRSSPLESGRSELPRGLCAHTEGPWDVRPGYGMLRAEIGPAGRAVATVWTKQAGTRDEQKEPIAWLEGEANARLIASAPELLEALRKNIDLMVEVARELKEPRMPLATAAAASVRLLAHAAQDSLAALAKAGGSL